MASGNFSHILVHGPSISGRGDNGKPDIWVSVSYNLSASGSGVSGTMSASLDNPQTWWNGYYDEPYKFYYYLTCELCVSGGDYVQAFTKPSGTPTWSGGDYNGTVRVSSSSSGVVTLYMKISSNCDCYGVYPKVFTLGTVTVYNTPSTPKLSSGSTIVKNGTTCTFNYTADTNYAGGTDYIQYSTNKSTILGSKVDSGAGSFDLKIEPGAGSSTTVYCRRYISELGNSGYSGWSNGVQIKVYSDPTVTVSATSPSDTVNGNTDTTIKWNSWSGSWSESATSTVELYTTNTSSGKLIQTIASGLASTITSQKFTPSGLLEYDNKTIYIKVTRKHTVTGVTGSGYRAFKVRYTPTEKIINLTNALGTINFNTKISWSYPTGYYGIVTGYKVELTNADTGNTVTDYTTTPSYTIDVNKLDPVSYYNLTITPYYLNDSHLGPPYTVVGYLQFIANLNKSQISYPRPNDCYWISDKSSFKVVFALPIDRNRGSIDNPNDYRYKDIEVELNSAESGTVTYSINDHPLAFSALIDNLTYRREIIFDPIIAGFDHPGNIKVRVRAKSHFGDWGDFSDYVTVKRFAMPIYNPSVGTIIPVSAINTVKNTCCYFTSYVEGSIPVINNIEQYEIIYRSFLNMLYDKVKAVYDTTANIVCDSGHDIRYNMDGYETYYNRSDTIVTDGYISYIYGAMKLISGI